MAAVRAVAKEVLEHADRLDGMQWPTLRSDEMTGSAASRAASSRVTEERVADVVAHMRTWAAAAQTSATAIDDAQWRHARNLGEGR